MMRSRLMSAAGDSTGLDRSATMQRMAPLTPGDTPYGVPYTGEPYYPEGTYGTAPPAGYDAPAGYGAAGGYGAPGSTERPDSMGRRGRTARRESTEGPDHCGAPGGVRRGREDRVGHGGHEWSGGRGETEGHDAAGAIRCARRRTGRGRRICHDGCGPARPGCTRTTDETADAPQGPTGTGGPQEDDGQPGQLAGSLAGDAPQGSRPWRTRAAGRRPAGRQAAGRQAAGRRAAGRHAGGGRTGRRRPSHR